MDGLCELGPRTGLGVALGRGLHDRDEPLCGLWVEYPNPMRSDMDCDRCIFRGVGLAVKPNLDERDYVAT